MVIDVITERIISVFDVMVRNIQAEFLHCVQKSFPFLLLNFYQL